MSLGGSFGVTIGRFEMKITNSKDLFPGACWIYCGVTLSGIVHTSLLLW